MSTPTITFEHGDHEVLCACADCGALTRFGNLDPIENPEQRIGAGEEVPAGQCPECGALAHLPDDDERLPGHLDVAVEAELLAATTRENLIAEALGYDRLNFDADQEVNGGDLVEFFADWRQRMRATFAATGAPE